MCEMTTVRQKENMVVRLGGYYLLNDIGKHSVKDLEKLGMVVHASNHSNSGRRITNSRPVLAI